MLVDVADVRGTIAAFAEAGVRAGAIAGKLRLMTHRDVGDKHIRAALDRIGEAKGVRSSESLVHLSTKIDRSA